MAVGSSAGTLRLCVSVPPSVNHLYMLSPRGRRILTPRGKAYAKAVGWDALQARLAADWRPLPPYVVTVRLRVAHRGALDADNGLKILIDSIFSPLQADDADIQELHVYKRIGAAPLCEVELVALGSCDPSQSAEVAAVLR